MLDEYYITNNFRYTHIYVCFICIFYVYNHVWKVLGDLYLKILTIVIFSSGILDGFLLFGSIFQFLQNQELHSVLLKPA